MHASRLLEILHQWPYQFITDSYVWKGNKAYQLTCVSQCQGHTHALQHFVVSPTPPLSLVPVLCK